jgi:triosephosphate isomerase
MVLYIRKVLTDEYGEDIGRNVPVLYGGSVFVNNAKQFLDEGKADGLLIGRESLKPVEFSTILKLAHEVRV